MTVSKKLLLPLAAVAVIGAAGAYGVSQASADSTSADPRASLVQKLADTFHLDKAKVQAVFDEEHAVREKQHKASYEQRLTQAVTDGKLTAAQKDAVLAEHNKLIGEIKALKGEMDGQTGKERRAAMDKIFDEGKAWAAQNNIDAKWLLAGPGGHGGPGMHGHGERMAKDLPAN